MGDPAAEALLGQVDLAVLSLRGFFRDYPLLKPPPHMIKEYFGGILDKLEEAAEDLRRSLDPAGAAAEDAADVAEARRALERADFVPWPVPGHEESPTRDFPASSSTERIRRATERLKTMSMYQRLAIMFRSGGISRAQLIFARNTLAARGEHPGPDDPPAPPG